jgi:RimJ/RimL family protein N-acetyltransferase
MYTNRLLLRRIDREDLEILLRWSRSADAYGSFLSPEQFGREELEQRFNAGLFWNRSEKLYLIEKRNDRPVGTIHYWLPADKMNTATVAIKIAEPHERNKGYGTEAQKSLLIHLFEKIKMRHVEMYTDLDNLAQQRCLKKLGFSLIETLTYDDRGIRRTGNLYRIGYSHYSQEPIYRYHYE